MTEPTFSKRRQPARPGSIPDVPQMLPVDWDRTIAAYGDGARLVDARTAQCVQGLLSFASEDVGDDDALAWVARLEQAARRSWRTGPVDARSRNRAQTTAGWLAWPHAVEEEVIR
jgi:hypothetical protein